MKFYKAKIQLGGSVQNEVIKKDLSAAEVVLLRRIHGEASVIDIEGQKAPAVPEGLSGDKWNDETVREHLRNLYGVDNDTKVDRVVATFGVEGVPLPQSVETTVPEKGLDEDTLAKIRAEEREKLEAEFALRDRKAEEMPAAAVIKENKAAGIPEETGLTAVSAKEKEAQAKAVKDAMK